jgi:Tfp pilus assembly protein PilF
MKQILFFTLLICLYGCSPLGIHVLNDSLTAAQHNDLGIAYEKQDRLDLAEKEYKRAIKKDKNWHVPYFNLGNVYYKLSNNDEAIKYFRSGSKANPHNPDIMNNLGFALMEKGNTAEAKKWIEKALSIEAKPEYLDTQNKIREKMTDMR